MGIYIPRVFTKVNGVDTHVDIFNYEFIKERKIRLSGLVDTESVTIAISQIQYLNKKANTPITLIINSQGGSVYAGLALYDAIQESSCDIITIGCGMVASMGAFLLAAGTSGKRFAYPNTNIMIHQPLSNNVNGQAIDIKIEADNIIRTKQQLNRILAYHCGRSVEEIEVGTERNNYMNAYDAKDYGLIDKVLLPVQKK